MKIPIFGIFGSLRQNLFDVVLRNGCAADAVRYQRAYGLAASRAAGHVTGVSSGLILAHLLVNTYIIMKIN